MTAPPPRSVCQRCRTILVDEWPSVVVVSRPGSPSEQVTLCGECADRATDWLSQRPQALAPLRGRVRVATAGRAFDDLFGKD